MNDRLEADERTSRIDVMDSATFMPGKTVAAAVGQHREEFSAGDARGPSGHSKWKAAETYGSLRKVKTFFYEERIVNNSPARNIVLLAVEGTDAGAPFPMQTDHARFWGGEMRP